MRTSLLAVLSLAVIVLFSSCTRRKEIRTVELGAKAEIGPFIYQAFETRWPESLGDRIAKDRFFTVRVSALNSGSADTTVPSFELLDDQGNAYPELADGTGVSNWIGVSRKVEPGHSEQGTVAFDVPPKHFRLRVADENDNFMYIDIPLNLTSEEPVDRKLMEAIPPPSK
jgi:hypothetical protein